MILSCHHKKTNSTESLWVEVSNGNSKYIVAGIYRHPNHNINEFSDALENSIDKLSKCKLPCIIAGDINIDLSKYNAHQDTTAYVNNLLLNNFMPMIIMPTRITSTSATIVDHIYYREARNSNNELRLVSGNLWSDLTDHLPNYFIIFNESVKTKKSERPLIRLFSVKNVNKFKQKLQNIDWDPLYNCTDVNQGYNFFSNKISESYHSSFKLVHLSRKRSKDKNGSHQALRKAAEEK